jgi:hypothetical protein
MKKEPTVVDAYVKRHKLAGMKRHHILNHDEFQSMRDGDRMLVMHQMDPEYRKMKPKDRWKLICDAPRPPT